MASPNQILGRATITVNGQRIASKPGASLDVSLGERQMEMGEFGPEGFSEKAKAAQLTATFYAKNGLTASQLFALVDQTIVFEADNGYSATLVQATALTVGDVKTGEGAGWEVKFGSMIANEATS